MKTQKLSLHDFEAVGTAELLEVKGGISDATLRRIIRMENDLRRSGTHGIGEDSGGCEGDANGFGGTFDADEVTVLGSSGPMINQQTGEWVHQPCAACSDANSSRGVFNRGLGTLLRDNYLHRSGCGGAFRKELRNMVWQDF